MKQKILFLLDYPRLEYINKESKLDYGASKEGKALKKILSRDLQLKENIDYNFYFIYGKVPEGQKFDYNGNVLSYKVPNATELKPWYAKLEEVITNYNPSVIIPMGALGTKKLLKTPISKCQGSVHKIKLSSKDYWVLPLYRQGYVDIQPNLANQRNIGFSLLSGYLEKGEEAFNSGKAESYYTPKSVDEFKKLIARCKQTGELAWDTETNTTNPNLLTSKVIMFSFAWADGQAGALPLEHNEVYQESGTTITGKPNLWSKEELKQLYDAIKIVLLAKTVGDIPWSSDNPEKELSKDAPLLKVGHNIKFDLNFLMGTGHIKWANNVTDTKVGYWLEVSQDEKTNKRLSELAFGLTGMGGYDQPLEDYKVWISTKVFPATEKVLKDKASKSEDSTSVMLDSNDKDALIKAIDWSWAKEHKFYYKGIEDWVIDIIAIPKINKYRTAKKVRNDYDPEAPGKNKTFCYEWNPLEIMSYYASGDADCCLRIHHRLLSMMEKDNHDPEHKLLYLYKDFYAKVSTGFSCLEHWGMRANTEYMQDISKKYTAAQEDILKTIESYPLVQEIEQDKQRLYEAGLVEFAKPVKERDKTIANYRLKYKGSKMKFNPKATADKALLFFDKMGYTLPYARDYIKDKVWSSNKSESNIGPEDYRTDKKALDYLTDKAKKDNNAENSKLLSLLREYSKVATLKSGFTDKLIKLISPKDQNVHGEYNITGTATSRSSSSNPNLQQLPSHTSDVTRYDYKYPIKRMFVSRYKNGKLFNIDYSNLEMRIMGLVTKEESMTNAFLSGHDIHKDNASMAFGVSYEKVTKLQRQAAKSIGFGLIYGRGAQSLSEQIGESLEESEKLTDQFFASKPRVKQFIEDTHNQVAQQGYVNTLSGFRRDLKDIWSSDKKKRKEAERQSVNTIIQGSGASLTNYAVYLISEMIIKYNLKSRIFVTVHDSIGLDCPPEEVPKVPQLALYIMQHLPFDWLHTNYQGKVIRYPVDADMDIGNNYNDMVSFDLEDYNSFKDGNEYINYYLDLSNLSDLYESKKLSEEEYKSQKAEIENKKEVYQAKVDN